MLYCFSGYSSSNAITAISANFTQQVWVQGHFQESCYCTKVSPQHHAAPAYLQELSTAAQNVSTCANCGLHRESKKTRHQTLSHNFTNYYPIFKIFFTKRLCSKFATNSYLNISPRLKHVATLPCEIWMSQNGIIQKCILQLMMNHKVV